MDKVYFFDTYAIIEILKANPRYTEYKKAKMVITVMNLIELHYKLLRDFNEKLANSILKEYSGNTVDIAIEIIKAANEFKYIHRKKRLSVADVIGYAAALKYGIKFLTGDRQFKGMRNVEFVK